MMIVQGVFRMDPAERDAFLAQSIAGMSGSRAEKGCLEYVMAADPVEPDRVVLSERWESKEDLDEHLRAMTARRTEAAGGGDPAAVQPTSREIMMYEVGSAQPLG
jgi:quinol monooxygenase YgiN